MPSGDKTGPYGQGPKTGRAAGYCAGYNNPGYMNPAIPRMRRARRIGFRGRNWMRGRGFGWRRNFYFDDYPQPPLPLDHTQPTTLTKDEEKNLLLEHLKDLEEQKEILHKRIKELSKKTDEP